ncbi:hypothetical protein [Mucilaginibacter polytrichastri]|uniref:hypothetical protein n=1 Tax=Mucilaginibacter polytrichastri TaxID=1302689 RepID=UPI001115307A|nr:hypothetical protein [Mucilaginibacter polytrichastri]
MPTTLLSGVLAAAQEPAHTGDITNTAGSLATTLKATGTAGTYGQVTTDAQGRVTAGVVIEDVAHGGTGFASGAIGDIPYFSTTAVISKISDIATGNVLRSGGVGAAPAYGKVNVTTDITGVVPAANLGTGTASSTTALFGDGTYKDVSATSIQNQNTGTQTGSFYINGVGYAGGGISAGNSGLGGRYLAIPIYTSDVTVSDPAVRIYTIPNVGNGFRIKNSGAIGAPLADVVNDLLFASTTAHQYTFPNYTGTVALQGSRYTASGNGTLTTIAVPHGLTGVTATSRVFATARSLPAGGWSYITTDATNVNFIYTTAPASGTSNLLYDIEVQP